MFNRIYSFLGKKELMYSIQPGFWEKKNWNNHALIDLINKTRKDINKGNYAYGVFVDFKIHLTDTVDHLMLLKISEYHGSNEFQIKGSFLISVTERSLFN